MISPLLAARQSALGGICQLLSAATRKSGVPGVSADTFINARRELTQSLALPSCLVEPGHRSEVETDTVEATTNTRDAAREEIVADCSTASYTSEVGVAVGTPLQEQAQGPSISGTWTGLCWRLAATSTLSTKRSAATFAPCGGLSRCLHTSPATPGAAAVSAVAAAAAAAAEAKANQQAAGVGAALTGRLPGGRRPKPLSPHAYEFQRRFFQLVNSGAAAAMAASDGAEDPAAEAAAHSTNSQAIRMLLAWLEEGRVTANVEYQQEREAAAATGGPSPPAPPPGTVAAPYRLDQQIIDRAMEVLWRLYHREGVVPRNSNRQGEPAQGASSSTTTMTGNPMGLSELLNAAEVLAAAAPAMGLAFKRPHYELLVELYGKRALQDPSTRRGLAQRLLAVRQQMVQQLLPLNQGCLNTLLQGVRTDPLLNVPTKLSWAVRLLERDLPIAGASASAAAGAAAGARAAPTRQDPTPGGISAPLQGTLGFFMRMAAREADWATYGKLEAVLVSRTRSPPPYEVLLDALSSASAAGGRSRLALGFLAQIEQLEAKGHQPGAQQQQQQRRARGKQQQQQGGDEQQQAAQQQAAQRQQQLQAERRLDAELRSLRQLVHLGAQDGDEQLARKSYDRLRRLFWRDHPAVAAAAAARARAHAAAEKEKQAAAAAAAAAAASGEAAAEDEGDVGEEDDEVTATAPAPDPIAAAGLDAVLEAAAVCPGGSPDATLELMSLSLSRRDWPGVLEGVAALAELQSLVRRSRGRVGRLLMEEPGQLDGLTSAYGGLGAVSEALIANEDDTVAYYTELLRRVGAAAAAGAAAPFAGSYVPFGPPLRAAAARADAASVSGIVRQMRALRCDPGADSYAAVVEASLRGGKPERVPGLIEMMLEGGLAPSGAVWEVQLRAATQSGDLGALQSVAERALNLAEENGRCRPGVAHISEQVLADAAALAEARADGRVASSIKLLRLRSEELRAGARERAGVAAERAAARNRRSVEAAMMRRGALQLQLRPPAAQQQ